MSLQDKIRRGRDAVRQGVEVVTATDLYPTPAAVAARMARAADLFDGCRVLEPSAGTGALVRAVRDECPTARITTVEQSPNLAARLDPQAIARDFLELDPDTCSPFKFDRILMNPPFSRGADIRHVHHALGFLAPRGVLVAIVAGGPRQARAFELWKHLEDLPSGTFQGTGVNARIIRHREGQA